jgi:precorrin-4/cobalt-precorrin-4 C11-methyltransferase
MKVYFIGAGPGDPELLTVKGARLIRNCRCCIYAGSLVGEGVVAMIPEEAEKHDSSGLSLDEILSIIRRAGDTGKDVIRLHSGDPSIFGAIGEQMKALDSIGIEYEVIPGVSSFQAAAAALKVELTAPEVSQAVVLTRTSGRTPMPESQKIEGFAKTRATLCLFLSTHKIKELAQTLSEHYGSLCPAALVFHASRNDQKIIRGTLADIGEKTLAQDISKTALILVGDAIGGVEHVSKLYDRSFSHGFRKAPEE